MSDGEETDDPTHADRRNFYKVEKWSRDGLRVELMLYAGNKLDKARRIFERTIQHRTGIRLTIRRRHSFSLVVGEAVGRFQPGAFLQGVSNSPDCKCAVAARPKRLILTEIAK